MDKNKRRKLEAAGWKLGDAADFLEMDDVERQVLETRVKLALAVRRGRKVKHLSQKALDSSWGQASRASPRSNAPHGMFSLDQLLRAFAAVGGRVVVREAASKSKSGKTNNKSSHDTLVVETCMAK